MSTFLYFAYGSNMSERRLKKRVPSAKVIGTGVLHNHCLTFHKLSKDKYGNVSGKCTIECSESDKVYGVLFKIKKSEEWKLDKKEGFPKHYAKLCVQIEMCDSKCGKKELAQTYIAEPNYICRTVKPYTWYKKHVLVGAKEANLPPYYIDCLEKVPACKDHCKKREACELSIYMC